ncbi:hypothetical protein DH09_12160 [Bacillaceae bacterium JMAK1]|nr:hypothetical protein DH09_12160 [Bacillaceae bacterium JMAK1]
MDTRELLLTQLQAIHNKSGWFVSMNEALTGVTDEEALWTNHQSANTIWGTVNHLLYYNRSYLNRFKNQGGSPYSIDSNDESFDNHSHDSWEDTTRAFDTLMTEWADAVRTSNEETLNEKAPDLTHLTIHNAYHIGQIVDIRKQQGVWDDDLGVD